ncbi:MAG: leucyl/phenylalanyl-tRNA--protein transferase, partial [Halieaceae bacterium]
EHLNSLGARNLSRVDFENLLEQTNGMKNSVEPWTVPTSCGELL